MISLAGLLCFSIGIPLGLMAVLYSRKRAGKLASKECVLMYGFLFQGFVPRYYYFEAVHMVRKVIFQIVAELPWLRRAEVASHEDDKNTQNAMTCLSIGILALMFQYLGLVCKPYDHR